MPSGRSVRAGSSSSGRKANTTAGRDDYRALNAFQCMNVNATVGDDGKPHVTAIEGHDQHYDQYGRNGLVWIMTPPLYYAVRETSTSLEILFLSFYA